MANEFYDLFNQLFYSTEIWGYLGLAFVIGFLFVILYKIKEFTPISFLILCFMGLHYIDIMQGGGYYIWHSVIAFSGAILTVLIGVGKWRHG